MKNLSQQSHVALPAFLLYADNWDKPPHWRPVVADWLGDVDHAVGGFLRGQLAIALILAVLYAIGLALMDVPLGALLGIISGLANLVPYMSIDGPRSRGTHRAGPRPAHALR